MGAAWIGDSGGHVSKQRQRSEAARWRIHFGELIRTIFTWPSAVARLRQWPFTSQGNARGVRRMRVTRH